MKDVQRKNQYLRVWVPLSVFLGAVILMTAQTSGCAGNNGSEIAEQAQLSERQWLAGDSHIHSHWSPGYDRTVDVPTIIKGADAIYSTPHNASMAEEYGLSWMVTTDHGGPNHSKYNADEAYPELERSRDSVSGVLQFYGMELNMPGMDHHTLIIPQTDDERTMLLQIENKFDKNDIWPVDPDRDTEMARVNALTYMKDLEHLPLLFANHPSRSATDLGEYGYDEPWELRANNTLAPMVYRGMEGAPGHQAASLTKSTEPSQYSFTTSPRARGYYQNEKAPTLGGFDQMTAIVGGMWDSLLGEGRRFWIVASSDSHVHYTELSRPGVDFWPGEFHKTYVHAQKNYVDVLDGLRSGRIFAVAGDLISALNLTVTGETETSMAGETLEISSGDDIAIKIQLVDPDTLNHNQENPSVNRVDLIVGEVRGFSDNENLDTNETTRVLERFTSSSWVREGESITIRTTLPQIETDMYVRVRGTSGNDLEPLMDIPGEDPWSDLWFYSNPVFVQVN